MSFMQCSAPSSLEETTFSSSSAMVRTDAIAAVDADLQKVIKRISPYCQPDVHGEDYIFTLQNMKLNNFLLHSFQLHGHGTINQ